MERVRYEEAIVLKKLGFDEPCTGYYTCPPVYITPSYHGPSLENPNCLNSLFPPPDESLISYASAPDYGQAFTWFETVEGLTTADQTLAGLQGLISILKEQLANTRE